jgi:hypothetical protein
MIIKKKSALLFVERTKKYQFSEGNFQLCNSFREDLGIFRYVLIAKYSGGAVRYLYFIILFKHSFYFIIGIGVTTKLSFFLLQIHISLK